MPEACRTVTVTVRWGDYELAEIDTEGGRRSTVWERTPREAARSVPLTGAGAPAVHEVEDSGGLELSVVERPIVADELTGTLLPAGTRSVSCFLVNRRVPDGEQPDRAYAFQAEIEVVADTGSANAGRSAPRGSAPPRWRRRRPRPSPASSCRWRRWAGCPTAPPWSRRSHPSSSATATG